MSKKILQFLEDVNNKRETAWRRLYKNYYIPLCHYALKIVNDRILAEDVVQEVLVRMWEVPLSFDSVDQLPRMQRTVILLSLEEKTVKEIAMLLSISPNTVKKYKKEAYTFLRKMLSNDSYIIFS